MKWVQGKFYLFSMMVLTLGACNLKELAESGQLNSELAFGPDYQKQCNAELPSNRLDNQEEQNAILFSVEEKTVADELLSVLRACRAIDEEEQLEFLRSSETSGNHWYRVLLVEGVNPKFYVQTLPYYAGVSSIERDGTLKLLPEHDDLFRTQASSSESQARDADEKSTNSRE